jgi:acetyltransferase-like isoleucine patch superfamily enzyme
LQQNQRNRFGGEGFEMAGLNNAFLSREVLETLGFAQVGEDVLIHSTVVIVDCSKVSLGSRVRIDPFVIISTRGGVEFGNNVHIGGHSVLVGHAAVHIGDFVNISHHVGIFTSKEDISGRTLSHPTVPGGDKVTRTASISFARHSGVGAGSLVLPGARFAEGSILGAMSRVGRPLKPWTTYAGIPARRMRERRRDVLVHEQEYLASLKKLG